MPRENLSAPTADFGTVGLTLVKKGKSMVLDIAPL